MKSKKQATGGPDLEHGQRGRLKERQSGGFEAGNAECSDHGLADHELDELPASVRACLPVNSGLYDAMRLRSQRDVIRDVMLAAAECGTWLTLAELRALTHYGEASISAQLRHLRKCEHGGYEVVKRHREDGAVDFDAATDRKEFTWEYRIGVKGYANVSSQSGARQDQCLA